MGEVLSTIGTIVYVLFGVPIVLMAVGAAIIAVVVLVDMCKGG